MGSDASPLSLTPPPDDEALDPLSASGRVLAAIYEMQDAEALYRARLRRRLSVSASELATVQYLARLGSRGLEARVIDVAAHLGVTTGAASIIVTRLAARGYITKRPDPRDGRGQHLDLTRVVRDAVASAAGSGSLIAMTRVAAFSDRESRRMVALLSGVTTGFVSGAPPEV